MLEDIGLEGAIVIEAGGIQIPEIHRYRDMPAPNLQTVSVFGIVAIPTQLVVIPFLKVSFHVKTHAHRTDSLAQRRLFLFIYFSNVATSSNICKCQF